MQYKAALHAHLSACLDPISAQSPAIPVAPVIVYGAGVETATERVIQVLDELSLPFVSVSDVEVDSPTTLFRLLVGRRVSQLDTQGIRQEDVPEQAAAVALSMLVHVGGKRASIGAISSAGAGASTSGVGAVCSFSDVALALRRLVRPEQALVLLLHGADRLAAHLPSHIAPLLRIAELSGRAVVPVLIAESATAVTRHLPSAGTPPLLLHVPPPSQAEAIDTLVAVAPQGVDAALYRTAVGHVWGAFHAVVGADIQELAYLVSVAWPLYTAEAAKASGALQPAALFKAVSPHFLAMKQRLLHRDLEVAPAAAAPGGTSQRGMDVELPHFAKYMLVAAFLASHNPADTDLALLSRAHSGTKRGTKRRRSSAKNSSSLDKGPKPFTLERLQAVFHALVAAHAGTKASTEAAGLDLLTTVATLISLGLLAKATARSGLDEVKLRCAAGRDTVEKVAQRLQLPLASFMASDA